MVEDRLRLDCWIGVDIYHAFEWSQSSSCAYWLLSVFQIKHPERFLLKLYLVTFSIAVMFIMPVTWCGMYILVFSPNAKLSPSLRF